MYLDKELAEYQKQYSELLRRYRREKFFVSWSNDDLDHVMGNVNRARDAVLAASNRIKVKYPESISDMCGVKIDSEGQALDLHRYLRDRHAGTIQFSTIAATPLVSTICDMYRDVLLGWIVSD